MASWHMRCTAKNREYRVWDDCVSGWRAILSHVCSRRHIATRKQSPTGSINFRSRAVLEAARLPF